MDRWIKQSERLDRVYTQNECRAVTHRLQTQTTKSCRQVPTFVIAWLH